MSLTFLDNVHIQFLMMQSNFKWMIPCKGIKEG